MNKRIFFILKNKSQIKSKHSLNMKLINLIKSTDQYSEK